MITSEKISIKRIWQILEAISDPEIPIISIIELGIVRDVRLITEANRETIEIIITPTYSGCPAMDVIAMDIRMNLLQNEIKNIKITHQLSPAWTTDWITKEGKDKLRSYGIAPPQTRSDGPEHDRINKMLFTEELNIECPQCRSKSARLLSQFGSTACKALYQCNDCKEPFDYFKCH